MANHNERATSSIPNWLLPNNGRKQTNRLGRAVTAASTSTHTSLSNHNHIQTQQRPSVPQHEPEPSNTPHRIFLRHRLWRLQATILWRVPQRARRPM